MLQNFAGMEPYKDEAIVSGIPFASGDVLIANIRPYLKKIWKANFAGCCNTDVLVLHSANINPDYLYYNIAREDFITHVMSGVKGSKMPRGDKTQILEYKVGVPTHKEQQKIASILSLLDNRIVKQRQLIEALKSYKRG
ncbi:restriction endonuclease subunit S, partial [Neglecta sp. X58]|nr:restriction endonuclease subunit S [Neglectibacter sp. X58]